MNIQNNVAYDLNYFASSAIPKERELKVVKNKNYSDTKALQRLNINFVYELVIKFCIVFISVVVLLNLQATVTETSLNINAAQNDITSLSAEVEYYKNVFLNKIDKERIESFAQSKGMLKIDPSQITYMDNVNSESIIKRVPTNTEKLIDSTTTFLTTVSDYFRS